jgi:hypothetical protein
MSISQFFDTEMQTIFISRHPFEDGAIVTDILIIIHNATVYRLCQHKLHADRFLDVPTRKDCTEFKSNDCEGHVASPPLPIHRS